VRPADSNTRKAVNGTRRNCFISEFDSPSGVNISFVAVICFA